MSNVEEIIKRMGICDEGNIVDEEDYEESLELDRITDFLKGIESGVSMDGEK